MTDLPADEFIQAALVRGEFCYTSVKEVKRDPNGYKTIIELARALERIAELEAQKDIVGGHLKQEIAIRVRTENERDEALARLAKYEPPVDPDLVLAREIEARLHAPDYVEHVLAGIKAGREAAQVKL